ncbi:uncharacterized protein MONOS_9632 [Monocercomonoides exilis]|uniref:uncharacterized protein n=1 Tax=Monocercomonoides exilis TaxID=2049356 RepID=UPI00355A7662|nr:hypothetical protein MONOS_9632 [Monocercomonoides exilis]|eukprot:MONOS_9632.1-p1 / transcript=MONOS_9632.1 / gene=MONOS_9632 / organism=Monocercomonoides_exilis_PA203 / gene_product=unspecified product / transcript_product=unspecified product / location=Mono_scaffold00404:6672-7927(-) / protein_length=398 / sequence_SO=supercontig / SO=protein_coding / is_pseudo=false
MSNTLDEMNEEEFESIFTEELFNKIDNVIEEKKMSMENALLLLKRIGYNKVMKYIWNIHFKESSLSRRIEKMIINEEQKKEGKNEKLLVDLCEFYTSLSFYFPPELNSVCVSYLLKVALRKEENMEMQKEVEIAMLALRNAPLCHYIEQKVYLKEITEIIKYHQKHRNMTRLAYQSAWQFLIYRLNKDESLKEVIVNELHFVNEVARELEELARCIDWERKKVEERGKEAKEELALMRWLAAIGYYLSLFELSEERDRLIGSIASAYRAVKNNCQDICLQCVETFNRSVKNRTAEVVDLLKGGAVNIILEEVQRPTLDDEMRKDFMEIFESISRLFIVKVEGEMEEEERKELKRKVFDKLEEEGYEDIIIRLCYRIYKWEFGDIHLIKNCSNYFVYL